MLEDVQVRGEVAGNSAWHARWRFHREQLTGRSRWFIWALTTVAFCTLGSVFAVLLWPGIRGPLLREDGLIETGSVLCLASVVIWAAAATVIRGFQAPLALGGLLGLAELLDETSFGARLFGFQPPPPSLEAASWTGSTIC